MNKQRFIKILSNYRRITDEDIQQLKQLAQAYPFSQIIHTLLAKAVKDASLPDAKQSINRAALYTTDRKVLKDFIEDTNPSAYLTPTDTAAAPTDTNPPAAEPPTPAAAQPMLRTLNPISVTPEDGKSDSLRDEVMRNLALLMESKKPYQGHEEEHQSPPDKKKKKKKEGNTLATPVAKDDHPIPSPMHEIVPERKKNNPLLRQKEQIDIIDRFIKAEPSLKGKASAKDQSEEAQKDLSETSAAFGEDLVSETLAKILVKQGKKDKAVDIYRKLIWKFPQKRAYFASLIEDLNT